MIDRPPWEKRRRVMWAVLGFCAVIVSYLSVAGTDTELSRLIAGSLIALCGGIVTSYLGIATWDDLNVMKHLGRDAYEARPPGWPKDIAPPEDDSRPFTRGEGHG